MAARRRCRLLRRGDVDRDGSGWRSDAPCGGQPERERFDGDEGEMESGRWPRGQCRSSRQGSAKMVTALGGGGSPHRLACRRAAAAAVLRAWE